MEQAVLDSLRSMYKNAGDLERGPEAIIEMSHPDVEIVPAPFWENMDASYQGHEGLRTYFAGLQEAFGGLHYELLALTPLSGDAVIADLLLTVDAKVGDEPRRLDAFQLLQLEDGKIRRSETFLYKKDVVEAASRL
jgi:SnoaL-like protein